MSGPTYNDRRPLAFLPGQSLINEREVLRVFSALNTLDSQDVQPNPEQIEVAHPEWLALQARYDLLLDMMGILLQRDQCLPPQRDFCFAMEHISWLEQQELEPGPGRLQIYLHDSYPRPLTLPGILEVQACNTEGSEYILQIDPLSPPLQVALERHVFRHHRRAVARRQNDDEVSTVTP